VEQLVGSVTAYWKQEEGRFA